MAKFRGQSWGRIRFQIKSLMNKLAMCRELKQQNCEFIKYPSVVLAEPEF